MTTTTTTRDAHTYPDSAFNTTPVLTDEQIAYIVGATTAAVEEALIHPEFSQHAEIRRTVAGALDALAIVAHQLTLARTGR